MSSFPEAYNDPRLGGNLTDCVTERLERWTGGPGLVLG